MPNILSQNKQLSGYIFEIPQSHRLKGELQQEEFHDQENSSNQRHNLEFIRPYGYGKSYEYLHLYNLKQSLKLFKKNKIDITNQHMLSICCGRGMDLDFFGRRGAIVSGNDISLSSLKVVEERLNKANSPSFGKLKYLFWGSARKLPFPDQSFDIVYVHDGLHHLEYPMETFTDMLRIAKKAVLIIEPNDSFLLRVLRKFKLIPSHEKSGNYIYRFNVKKLQKIAKKNNFSKTDHVYTSLMYAHDPLPIYKKLDNQIVFRLMQVSLFFLRHILRNQSNHMVFLARK